MEEKTVTAQVMHSFKEVAPSRSLTKPIIIWIIVVLLGIASGYVFSGFAGKTGNSLVSVPGMKGSSVQVGKTYGSDDSKTFKDSTEGVVKNGGIEGEGQYHLVRPGGDSQNVYMTSSTVDLSQFIDHKVKVWGQTQQAQHAGWLMDVGRVEVEQ